MFKRADYIIISITCCVLGIALMSQFYSSKSSKNLLQPENNDVLAVEIEKLAKSNSAMKVKITELTGDYNDYVINATSQNNYTKYLAETNNYDEINGVSELSGQGVEINIDGNLSTAQLVDLINAIKNIGTEVISINGVRIILYTYINSDTFASPYKISALGNSNLLESALTRKGGIIEQIKDKNIDITISKKDMLIVPSGELRIFNKATILER